MLLGRLLLLIEFVSTMVLAMPPAIPYELSLKRNSLGEPTEHWSLVIHKLNAETGTQMHAVSNPDAPGKQLETERREKPGQAKVHSNGGKATVKVDKIAGFRTQTISDKALKVLTSVRLTKPPPTENCVDWTERGMKELHAKKLVDDAALKTFMAIYNENQKTVRENTKGQFKT